MSADSFHADVEKGIKRNGDVVYDFKDYCNIISNANDKKCQVKSMAYYDFGDWRDGHSEYILKNKKLNPYGRPHIYVTYTLFYLHVDHLLVSIKMILIKPNLRNYIS